MIAMLAAMEEEIVGIKERMIIEGATTENGCQIFRGKYRGKEALLVQTGMGRERAEAAVRLILEQYPISALVSFGFGGALTKESRAGDVFLCSKLHCADGQSPPHQSDANLISQSLQMPADGAIPRLGEGITTTGVVGQPKAKRALHGDVVDMESYWIARAAAERQVPFLAVRAVIDSVSDSLPPFDRMLGPDGQPMAVRYFLSHPWRLMQLFTLYRNMRRARKSLTSLLDRLVERLG